MFQSLKEKSVLFLLENGAKPKFMYGEVVSVKYPQMPVGGQYSMNEMNIVVKTDGGVVNLEGVPCYENIFTSKDGSLTVSDSQEVIAAHVANLNRECKRKIKEHEYNVTASKEYDGIELLLNPQLAKEQERDAEMQKLNERMNGLEQNITGIQDGIKELLGTLKIKK